MNYKELSQILPLITFVSVLLILLIYLSRTITKCNYRWHNSLKDCSHGLTIKEYKKLRKNSSVSISYDYTDAKKKLNDVSPIGPCINVHIDDVKYCMLTFKDYFILEKFYSGRLH